VTTDERIEPLTGIVEALAGGVSGHEIQIEGLIRVAKNHQEEWHRHEASLVLDCARLSLLIP